MQNEESTNHQYGWGNFRPKVLQRINNPKFFFFFLCLFSTFEGMMVDGLTGINVVVLEKRFQLSSREIGFIASSNVILGIVLICFVSFYGTYSNKPKWLGLGSLMTGIGCFVFTLPHFISDRYEPLETNEDLSTGNTELCNVNGTHNGTQASTCFSGYSGDWHYLFIFVVAQLIMGAGKTPLFPLGLAYLDENVSPKSAPVFIGLFLCSVMIGPGAGYVIGGALLDIWVDIEKPGDLPLTPGDPRWIGAWWIGYLIGGSVLMISSVFLLGFPRVLPGSRQRREKAIRDGNLPKLDDRITGKFSDIFPATISLLKNPTYVFTTISMSLDSLFVAGIGTFQPKFVQAKYGASPLEVGLGIGVAALIAGGLGNMLGAAIVRSFNLKQSCKKSAKCYWILVLVSFPVSFFFLIPGCDDVQLAGVTTSYKHDSSSGKPSLLSPCNANCSCSLAGINPVCGDDKLVYFSPCHAGCQNNTGPRTFSNCTCIAPARHTSGPATAARGYCDRGPGCQLLYVFLTGEVIVLILVFMAITPAQVVCLRAVADNQRAYAVGIQVAVQRSLGLLPGPLLFGAVFDLQCLMWGESCGMRGSCQLYDVWLLSVSLTTMAAIIQLLMSICTYVAFRCCKPSYEEPARISHEAETAL